MRLFTRALIVLGLLIVVLAGAFKLGGPDLLVKYPGAVDKTFDQTGDTTLYVAPQSVTPVSRALVLPLAVKVRLHTIGHVGNNIVVAEDQQQNINKGALKADQKLTFVFDRSSMKNVTNVRAFAFDPTRGLDRSPNYAVNFPIHTGSGPYAVWKDETGSTFPMNKVGQTSRNGVTLTTMRGTLSGVPLASYYVNTLPSIFVEKQEPLSKLSAALAVTRIDPVVVTRSVQGLLTPGDNAAITRILAQPVPLSFTLAATTTMQVEPTTGVIAGMNVDQTISAVPSVAQITMIQSILGQPRYADQQLVKIAAALMARLAANPPSTRILRIRYSSTPASLTDLTSYAHHLAGQIGMIETTIPMGLLVLGLVLFAAGVVLRTVRGPGHPTPPPPTPKHRPGRRPAPPETPVAAGPDGSTRPPADPASGPAWAPPAKRSTEAYGAGPVAPGIRFTAGPGHRPVR